MYAPVLDDLLKPYYCKLALGVRIGDCNRMSGESLRSRIPAECTAFWRSSCFIALGDELPCTETEMLKLSVDFRRWRGGSSPRAAMVPATSGAAKEVPYDGGVRACEDSLTICSRLGSEVAYLVVCTGSRPQHKPGSP